MKNEYTMKIRIIIREIINPRFSIDEMENSRTQCGCELKITSMFFDDNKRHFPTKAIGWIGPVQGSKIIATWNQHGECLVNGRRIKSFDLVKPTKKELDAVRPVFLEMISIVTLLIL